MAEYAANVLKTEALYYRLSRASLRDGILHLSSGGYAETEVTSLQLTNLTEYFRVSYMATKYCDSYESNIRIYVWAKDKDGNNYNYTFFPCDTEGNLFLQEFQVKAAPYEKLTWRIESDVAVDVLLWELCPEAEDINVQTIIDGVQQSLPRLLYDYNTWPLTVEDGEATVGLITFRLIDKTDLQGHFIMSFFASEAAILTVRFYTNEIEELFAPLTYDIRKGYNSIGIPHCYLHRSAGFYSVMATAQVSAGIVTIPTRGVLYSIDGGYLAKRELDVAMDVQDLAIRQTSVSYGPDEVWLVGIDAGEILVRKRDYNETNPNVAWTPVLSLGSGIAAAIEFDGYWNFRVGTKQYTIETEEEPWYFWVDSDGILWGRYGTNEDTLIQMDTGVSLVHACRGYKSEMYLDQDQGLVVVYLKDGYIWYRQYIWDNYNHYKRWTEPEDLLSSERWDDVRITRLNDYRLAIEASNQTHNVWFYTSRTYVGNAAPTEYVYEPSYHDSSTLNYIELPIDETLRLLSSSISEDRLTLEAVFDKELILPEYTVSLHDIITFDGGIVWDLYNEERNTVKDVQLVVDEDNHTTTITVTLLTPPSSLICHLYWNAAQTAYVHIKILPEWESPNIQSISVTYDSVIYRYHNQKADNVTVVAQSTGTPQYRALTEPKYSTKENVVVGTYQSGPPQYKALNNVKIAQRETHCVDTFISTNPEYIQVGDLPI